VEEADGSWYYTFEFVPISDQPGYMVVEKGSVCVNGVSLTVVNAQNNSFQVAIIPFTHQVTNFHCFQPGSIVNLEFDILGKYIARILQAQGLVK
jgi:riboflavin synthase